MEKDMSVDDRGEYDCETCHDTGWVDLGEKLIRCPVCDLGKVSKTRMYDRDYEMRED